MLRYGHMPDASAVHLDNALFPPWRECFELAWDALRAGSVPVGAMIVDQHGTVVSRGRSRSLEATGPAGQLWDTYLAHAEVNALAGLPSGHYPHHTLYTTLEPCLLCSAAATLCHVGTVRYAGSDPLWSGVERLPELNEHIARRWPARYGPVDGPLALFGTLFPLIFSLRRDPHGPVAVSHERSMPLVVALARDLLASGEADSLETESMPDALATVWDRFHMVGHLPYGAGYHDADHL